MADPKEAAAKKAAAKKAAAVSKPIANPNLSTSVKKLVSGGTINEKKWGILNKINPTATTSAGDNKWNAKRKELKSQQRKADSTFIVNNRFSSFNKQSSQLTSKPTPQPTASGKTSFSTKFKRGNDGNLTAKL